MFASVGGLSFAVSEERRQSLSSVGFSSCASSELFLSGVKTLDAPHGHTELPLGQWFLGSCLMNSKNGIYREGEDGFREESCYVMWGPAMIS